MNKPIIVVGPIPPPLYGLSSVNSAVINYLSQRGASTYVFSTASTKIGRALYIKLRRGLLVFLQLWNFYKCIRSFGGSEFSLYMSVSSGYGQLFESLFAVIARLFNASIVLHHHSFLYLNNSSAITKFLFCCCGKNVVHVVLCDIMYQKLKQNYQSITHVIKISNAVFIKGMDNFRARSDLTTIGFIGNIEGDKGIYEFLEILRLLQKGNIKIGGVIAGPFFDNETKIRVLSFVNKLSNVSYIGPIYGNEKIQYFNSIDALIYPTKNDAEPLTIIESMSCGVPILARSRGCINEMVTSQAGAVIDFKDDFISVAIDYLRVWSTKPETFIEKSKGAFARHKNMRISSMEALENLYSVLTT